MNLKSHSDHPLTCFKNVPNGLFKFVYWGSELSIDLQYDTITVQYVSQKYFTIFFFERL